MRYPMMGKNVHDGLWVEDLADVVMSGEDGGILVLTMNQHVSVTDCGGGKCERSL